MGAARLIGDGFYGVDVRGMEAVREKIQRGEATVEDMAFMATSRQRLWDIGYHLKALVDEGILESSRFGKFTTYKLKAGRRLL